MTNINQSLAFAFSFSGSLSNTQQSYNGQCFDNGQSQMMPALGMMFGMMDIMDNNQLDGSIFNVFNGNNQGCVNNQNGLNGQNNFSGINNGFNNPNSCFGTQQQNNPMTQIMQLMAMMFGMMDIMDDGQMNGSIMDKLMGQNGGFGSNGSPFGGSNNFGSPYGGSNNYGSQYGGSRNYSNNGINGAYGSGASNSLMNSQPSDATFNPGAGTFGGKKLSQEQVNNARIIAEEGAKMGASKRDISIAIATAMQESGLKNINYGDRDSVGLFQQRPSCGWGSVSQCTDPRYASRQFFKHLLKDGNRDNKSLTQAAQHVQRSAYPNAYAKWENMATSLTNSIC